MQVFFVKYIQVFCMTLFFTNNVDCDQYVLPNGNERFRLFGTSACTSQCMVTNETLTIEECYNDCKETTADVQKNLKMLYENLDIKLYCRDDTTLVLKIVQNPSNGTDNDTDPVKSPDASIRKSSIYVIQLHERDEFFNKEITYLANSSFITIENLAPNTKYNISATAVYANYEYSSIAIDLQFSTLQKRYTPKEVLTIDVLNFEANSEDPNTLNAIISWNPAIDMTCFYDILYYSPYAKDIDFMRIPIRWPEDLYSHTLEGLSFDTDYTIAIRGKNTKELARESELTWHNIKTPSCLKWYNNSLTICPPMKPTGLTIEEKHIASNSYSLNITWDKPSLEPEYYVLKILDLTLLKNTEGNSISVNVTKGQTFVFLPTVTLTGHQYEVLLTAFSFGGNTSTMTRQSKAPLPIADKNQILKLLLAIVVPIICIAVVSLLIVVICHRRAKLKRYQERYELQELEEKAPVDPKSTFQFTSKNLPIIPPASNVHQINSLQQDLENILCINDEMELDKENVTLLEVLGEGAFGLVRKGILKINETEEREVAVKMLKDHPSSDDIKEFRREIEVMKFVGKHPNIVGILGHCTKNLNEMLLLTEYCSLGNLLNFLRSEWNYLNKIRTEDNSDDVESLECLTPFLAAQKEPENVFNFDTSIVDKVSIKYKNIGQNTKIKGKPDTDPINNEIVLNDTENNSTNLVINKLYGLNGHCTNSCKCKVDIISDEKCLDNNDNISIEQQSNLKIKIHNCECKMKDLNVNGVKLSPLGVENKGYYKFISDNKETTSHIKRKRERLTSGDLLHIAKQIGTGMEFLSKNRVVHRDLAARNVLVCEDRTVKIADFGLSRDVYQENIYKKIGNGKLPIKWLALESMTHQVYTSQSDVWAYGILLYEIVTLGGTPYPSIPTNQLLNLLKTGYRMEKPKNCNQQLYNLMLSCWDVNPSERPTFSEICHILDNLLFNSSEEQIINLKLTEIVNKRSKSSSDESYLKPL